MNKNYDVAVIGGGASGLGIALGLAEHGTNTAVIDPGADSAGGATLAAGAMIDAIGECVLNPSAIDKSLLQMRIAGQQNYLPWLEQIESYSGHKVHINKGMFIIGNAGGDADLKYFKIMRSLMKQHNIPFDETDPSEVPGLAANVLYRPHSAIFMPDALSVDPASLLNNLSKAFCSQKSTELIHEKAIQLEKVGTEWEITLSGKKTIAAKNIVLSAGARCPELLSDGLRAEAGIPEIYFGRGIGCVTNGGPDLPYAIRTPNRALACGIHIVPRSSGQIYIGASNLFGMDLTIPKGPSVGELHATLGTACNQLNTTLRNVSISSFHWGLRPVTTDGAPLIGATGIEGLFMATAMHRTGVNLAPVIKDILCNEILNLGNGTINPFPLTETKVNKNKKDVALGMRSLIATALYPDGQLPYNRSQELEVFMTELFNMAMNGNKNTELQDRIKHLYNHIDMDEQAMIRVFHEILNEKIPDMGPFSL